jgi:hypothetical protein
MGSNSTPYPSALIGALKTASPGISAIAYVNGESALPSDAVLGGYGAILVYNDNNPGNAAAIGTSLTTYVNNGGRAVVANFANGCYSINANFGTYMVLNAGGTCAGSAADTFDPSNAAQALVPASPILQGLPMISGTGWHTNLAVSNGGVAVAKWASGNVMAATGTVNGHNRVDIAIHPSDVNNGGWGTVDANNGAVLLIRNALVYR